MKNDKSRRDCYFTQTLRDFVELCLKIPEFKETVFNQGDEFEVEIFLTDFYQVVAEMVYNLEDPPQYSLLDEIASYTNEKLFRVIYPKNETTNDVMFWNACIFLYEIHEVKVKKNSWLYDQAFIALANFDQEGISYKKKISCLKKLMSTVTDATILATGDLIPTPDDINDTMYNCVLAFAPKRMYTSYR